MPYPWTAPDNGRFPTILFGRGPGTSVRACDPAPRERRACLVRAHGLPRPHAHRRTDDSRSYLPEKRVWSILIQTALALEELHNCKILHRDVKPAVRGACLGFGAFSSAACPPRFRGLACTGVLTDGAVRGAT